MTDFKTRNVIKGKGRISHDHKGSILQEDIIVLKVYVPNNRDKN